MKVVGVANKYIALKKDNDTLVLVPVVKQNHVLKLDLKKLVYVTVNDNAISAQYYGGCEITDF